MTLVIYFNGQRGQRSYTRMKCDRAWNFGIRLISWLCFLGHTSHVSAEPGPLPSFTNTPTDVSTPKGYEAVLRCGVENLGTKTVSWRKLPYNVPITVGKEQFLEIDRFKLHHILHNGEWNLHIKNAQTFDSGTYECQVSLKESKIRRNITLVVTERPTSVPTIEITGTQFVEKGQPISLTCNVTSENPPEQIDWFKQGRRVETSYARQVYIHQQLSLREHLLTSTLDIVKAKMSDMGEYVCRASKHLVTRIKVDVLNAETDNKKRETPYDTNGGNSNGASYTSTSAAISLYSLQASKTTFITSCALLSIIAISANQDIL